MKSRFNHLTIQGKLFAIFGFIILLAALVVGTNTYTVIRMAQGNTMLERIFNQLMASYDAMSLIQQLEGAQRAYLVTGDSSYFDELTDYSARLDTLLREAMLKANDNQTKTNIYQLQQVKWSHNDTLATFPAVYESDDWELVEVTWEQADTEIWEMYELVGDLIERDQSARDRIDEETSILQLAGFMLNTGALGLFLVLAVVAALVISTQIIRPILLVNEAVTSLRAGTFESQQLAAPAKRTDEIGGLARAFLKAADAVTHRREAVEQESAELRANLEP